MKKLFPDFLTTDELAQKLGVNAKKIYYLIDSKQINAGLISVVGAAPKHYFTPEGEEIVKTKILPPAPEKTSPDLVADLMSKIAKLEAAVKNIRSKPAGKRAAKRKLARLELNPHCLTAKQILTRLYSFTDQKADECRFWFGREMIHSLRNKYGKAPAKNSQGQSVYDVTADWVQIEAAFKAVSKRAVSAA